MNLKSLWHKHIFSSKPWVEVNIIDGNPVVVDYNHSFIEEQRRKAGAIGWSKKEEELVQFFLDPTLFDEPEPTPDPDPEVPKIELGYEDGKLSVKSYNSAFVEEQRKLIGEITEGLSDEDVVKLFLDRESLDREEPKLDILHMGIEADGKVKVNLDWNRAFIKMLKDHGITGETEDEAIQKYLQLLSMNELQGDLEPEEFYSREQLEAAFSEMDQELAKELDDAKKQTRKPRRRTFK